MFSCVTKNKTKKPKTQWVIDHFVLHKSEDFRMFTPRQIFNNTLSGFVCCF